MTTAIGSCAQVGNKAAGFTSEMKIPKVISRRFCGCSPFRSAAWADPFIFAPRPSPVTHQIIKCGDLCRLFDFLAQPPPFFGQLTAWICQLAIRWNFERSGSQPDAVKFSTAFLPTIQGLLELIAEGKSEQGNRVSAVVTAHRAVPIKRIGEKIKRLGISPFGGCFPHIVIQNFPRRFFPKQCDHRSQILFTPFGMGSETHRLRRGKQHMGVQPPLGHCQKTLATDLPAFEQGGKITFDGIFE